MVSLFFNKEPDRPRLKLRLSSADLVIEFLGFAFLVILVVLPLIHYKQLPERIPVHFDAAGQPDGYGSRNTLLILPLFGFLMYLIMTVISFFPQVYNYPVKITPENAEIQYRLATRLIRIMKTVLIIMFSFIIYQTISTTRGTAAGLGKLFLPVFLTVTFGTVIVYFVQSMNNRRSS